MYRNIMVPTDGSGFDREAIRVALRLAERSEAKVRLVRVLSQGSFFGIAAASEGTSLATEMVLTERDRALAELYALAAECRATADADITVDLHSGPVADVLERYASRHDCDLIVMSTHARSGIARMSLGSVTDSLIRHTTVPVLVVKPASSYLDPHLNEPFRRILVPLDGSSLAEQVLPRAVAFAKVEGSEITLLHVLPSQAFPQQTTAERNTSWADKTIARAEEYLFAVAERVRVSDIPTLADIVISENVPTAISDYAAREGVSVIAIATHGRGGVARMLHGSVADALIHSTTASMLVFKPQLKEEIPAPISGLDAELISA